MRLNRSPAARPSAASQLRGAVMREFPDPGQLPRMPVRALRCPPTVAVVAHSGKSLDGGLPELRRVLAAKGVVDPLWYEVPKSRKAPKAARRALARGAELVFVWGGDGMVQRCIDALAGTEAVVAILPAGTANLLATNLQIPANLAAAVQVGLYGDRRPLDTGSVNDEHFAVMAGAGFDARMIKSAGRGMKDHFGRAAYLITGTRNLNADLAKAVIKVDGKRFFKGRVSCVLVGNVSKILGGIEVFTGAEPDDGLLELGVVTAQNPVDWVRTLGRVALSDAEKSPFVETTRGKKFRIRFAQRFPYELDGGARPSVKKIRIDVHPASIRICVPPAPEATPHQG
jgi:diacylglycerol kinase (ATP)